MAGERPGVPADWFGLGLPNWLCDRAERLGFAAPTEVQRLVLPAACAQRDVLVRAGTGCGKTLAFLLPVLSNLDFTDRVFPQVIIAVPTRRAAAAARALRVRSARRNVPGAAAAGSWACRS